MLNELKPFLDRAMVRRFPKGSIVLYQGEAPRSGYIVKSGVIKVYSIAAQGEEQIVAFQIAGEIFPAAWLFQKNTSTMYYYETLTDTELYLVSRDALMSYFFEHPKLLQASLDYFVTAYTGSLLRITALEQSRASEKIMYTLYYLLMRYGKETLKGQFAIRLELTHQVVASLVGLTRETTAIELNKLKKKGVVSYKGHNYLVDRNKLVQNIGEDNFEDLKM